MVLGSNLSLDIESSYMDQFIFEMYSRCKAGLNCCDLCCCKNYENSKESACVNEADEYGLLIQNEISDNEMNDKDDIARDSYGIRGDSDHNDDYSRKPTKLSLRLLIFPTPPPQLFQTPPVYLIFEEISNPHNYSFPPINRHSSVCCIGLENFYN